MVDIDNTLVTYSNADHAKTIVDPLLGDTYKIELLESNTKYLKFSHAKGYTTVLWSRQGYRWVEEVVRLFELEPWVDVILSKPIFFLDDTNNINHILGTNLYFPKEHRWGEPG